MITTTSGGLLVTACESRAGQSKNDGFAKPEEILPSVLVLTTPLRWPNEVRSAPSHSAKESPATYIRSGFTADTCRIARLPCAEDGLVTTGGTGTGGTGTGGPGTVGVGPGTISVGITIGTSATRGELAAAGVRVLTAVRELAAVCVLAAVRVLSTVRVLAAVRVAEARGTVAAAAFTVGDTPAAVLAAVPTAGAVVGVDSVGGATVGVVVPLHAVSTNRSTSGTVSHRQRSDRTILG